VINVAARLCDRAAPGQLLMAEHPDAFVPPWAVTRPHGLVEVAGLSRPLAVHEVDLRRDGGAQPVMDPVCGLPVDPSVAVAPPGEHAPHLRCFCSTECAEHWGRASGRRVHRAA
jgi:hypothetical protein